MSDDDRICENQPYGQHILVICPGCKSRHSTKNIGSKMLDNSIFAARSIFDVGPYSCKCDNPIACGLEHVCERDDKKTGVDDSL